MGFEARAGDGAGLIDDAADGRRKHLAPTVKDHGRLRQRDARIVPQFLVDGQ